MANSITIPLDPQTAQAYDSSAPEDKRKIQALLGLWLRELTNGDHPSLQQILDEVGKKAKSRGLTPEILESLLKALNCAPYSTRTFSSAPCYCRNRDLVKPVPPGSLGAVKNCSR